VIRNLIKLLKKVSDSLTLRPQINAINPEMVPTGTSPKWEMSIHTLEIALRGSSIGPISRIPNFSLDLQSTHVTQIPSPGPQPYQSVDSALAPIKAPNVI